jgi:Holliday junction resolvasome RuvABC DNA-binding subunit
LEGLGPRTAGLLEEHGIKNIEQLKETSPETMVEIPGIGLKSAEVLIARANAYIEEHAEPEPEEPVAPEGGEDEASEETSADEPTTPEASAGDAEDEGAPEDASQGKEPPAQPDSEAKEEL